MLDALQNAFFQTGDTLTSWLSAFSSFLWGWPLLIMLLGTHLYLTAILRFPQRYLLKALKLYFVKDHTDKGDISPFSSLMVALAANIGAGNIIGVGVAIAAGGPMFVLERGLNSKWLGTAFAVFTAIAAFGIGNLTQGNAAAEQLHHAFSIPFWGTAAVLTALTALVMLGGIQGIARVCAFFVPFMAVIYIMGCLYILTIQAEYIIPAIRYILDCAFTGEAAAGGAAGAAVMAAMRTGVARGLFSNEAGLGSAAIASAAAQNRNPVRQALISSSGPFWDTVIICALTGIVLTTSIIAHPDISCTDGPRLTTLAFSKIPYIGSPLLTLSLVTFVVSTILGWSYFGEKALEYLGGIRLIMPYRVIWVAAVFIGCVSKIELVWIFADCANGLMSLPNLISLLALSGVLVQQTRYYLWQHRLDDYDESHIPEGK